MRHTVLVIVAWALLVAAALPGAPAGSPEFRRSAAGVYGRIQMMRQLEKGMAASSANPERALWYLGKRKQARWQIDELLAVAQAAARSAEERRRLQQLATLTRVADTRFERNLFQLIGAAQ